MKSSTAHRAWMDLNSVLRFHKLINAGALLVCLAQTVVILSLIFSDPVVVKESDGRLTYMMGIKAAVPINEQVVEDFVYKFLKIRYEWQELDPSSMAKSLQPVVTDGLSKKLYGLFAHLKDKEFEGKDVSQSIVNVKIEVTKEQVAASFDKLLKIEGIPIPVPTTVSLNIIRGSSNRWNPVGLYVNGIKEHQVK